MTRKYYTLVRRYEDENVWHSEFGAYDRKEVAAELEDYCTGGRFVKRKNLKIISSGDGQDEIDIAVAKLNGK